MIDNILIKRREKEAFDSIMDSDLEWIGLLGAEKTTEGFLVTESKLIEQAENRASLLQLEDYCKYLSEKKAIIIDSHSRKNGKIIMPYDPYWSVGRKMSQNLTSGTIYNNFYISKNEKADSDVIEYLQLIGIQYAIFAHPSFKSEGNIMTSDKIQLTGYKYNSESLGRVLEIPLKII